MALRSNYPDLIGKKALPALKKAGLAKRPKKKRKKNVGKGKLRKN